MDVRKILADSSPVPPDQVLAAAESLISYTPFRTIIRHLYWQYAVDFRDTDPGAVEEREKVYYRSQGLEDIVSLLDTLASDAIVARRRDERAHEHSESG